MKFGARSFGEFVREPAALCAAGSAYVRNDSGRSEVPHAAIGDGRCVDLT
jgi:hypothetical protein